MLKTESSTIGGFKYEVTQLPYRLGKKVLFRIQKVLLPAVAKTLEGDTESLADRHIDFMAGVSTLAERLPEEDFDFIIDTLAEHTSVEISQGKLVPLKDIIELHFAGEYLDMFKWLGFALQVNYLGFLKEQGGLTALLEKAQSLREMASRSPTS